MCQLMFTFQVRAVFVAAPFLQDAVDVAPDEFIVLQCVFHVDVLEGQGWVWVWVRVRVLGRGESGQGSQGEQSDDRLHSYSGNGAGLVLNDKRASVFLSCH